MLRSTGKEYRRRIATENTTKRAKPDMWVNQYKQIKKKTKIKTKV